jgi:multidrug efflux pump
MDLTPNRAVPGQTHDPRYLRLDVTLPMSASAERTLRTQERCERLLREVEGVTDVLTLCGPPAALATNEGYLPVRLAPVADRSVDLTRIAQALRTRLRAEIVEASVRLSNSCGAGGASEPCPVDLALHGPDGKRVRELADRISSRLRESKRFTDVCVSFMGYGYPAPQLFVDVDRAKAEAHGVKVDDVLQEVQAALGGVYVNDFNRFGRTWQVIVSYSDQSRGDPERIRGLSTRNGKGELVPHGAVLTIKHVSGAIVLSWFNGQPMVPITANLEPGLSPAVARLLCEALAAEVLPAGYRLSWLREVARAE